MEDTWNSVRSFFSRLFRRHPGHYLKERYGIDEKPPGWNEAVLGHFHHSPEGRHASASFAEAFHQPSRGLPVRPRAGRKAADVSPLDTLVVVDPTLWPSSAR